MAEIDLRKKGMALIILVSIVVLFGIYAIGQEKKASAILTKDSKLTIMPGKYLEVQNITLFNKFQRPDFTSDWSISIKIDGNIYDLRRGERLVLENDWSLTIRDFIILGDNKPAAIVTNSLQQPTLPFGSKVVATSFLPIKAIPTEVPPQFITPIPTSGFEAPTPTEVEELKPKKQVSLTGERYLFAPTTLEKEQVIIADKVRNVSWTYGGKGTGFISYKEIEGYIVAYKGDINGKEQNIYTILQKDKPSYFITLPNREFIFEVHLEPMGGIWKVVYKCIGGSCKKL